MSDMPNTSLGAAMLDQVKKRGVAMSSLSLPLLLTVIAGAAPGPPLWCRDVVVESSHPPCWPATVTLCVAF